MHANTTTENVFHSFNSLLNIENAGVWSYVCVCKRSATKPINDEQMKWNQISQMWTILSPRIQFTTNCLQCDRCTKNCFISSSRTDCIRCDAKSHVKRFIFPMRWPAVDWNKRRNYFISRSVCMIRSICKCWLEIDIGSAPRNGLFHIAAKRKKGANEMLFIASLSPTNVCYCDVTSAVTAMQCTNPIRKKNRLDLRKRSASVPHQIWKFGETSLKWHITRHTHAHTYRRYSWVWRCASSVHTFSFTFLVTRTQNGK